MSYTRSILKLSMRHFQPGTYSPRIKHNTIYLIQHLFIDMRPLISRWAQSMSASHQTILLMSSSRPKKQSTRIRMISSTQIYYTFTIFIKTYINIFNIKQEQYYEYQIGDTIQASINIKYLEQEMRRVVITGMGMVSPLANSLSQSWLALLANKSGIQKHQNDPKIKNQKSLNLAIVKDFDQKKWAVPHATSRQNGFTMAATHEALHNSQLDFSKHENLNKVGICLGVIGSNTTKISEYAYESMSKNYSNINRLSLLHLITSIPAGALNVKYKLNGPTLTVNTACASGLSAIVHASKYIKLNQADVMIAGGVEDSYNPIQINSCLRIQAMTSKEYEKPEHSSRPFDKKRSGFVLGQGCGIVILEELNHALRRNANILGQILGFGECSDGHHLVKPLESGVGQMRAMQQAIQRSGLSKQEIQLIDAHATSTPAGDQIEANSIKKVFSRNSPYISANKSVMGHTLGAAGALQLILALKAMNKSIIPKILNLQDPDVDGLNYVRNTNKQIEISNLLKNSFGFGGVNVSIVVGKYK